VASRRAKGESAGAALDAVQSEIAGKMAEAMRLAAADPDLNRRMGVQLGGDAPRDRLKAMSVMLRNRPLIDKARSFGHATNSLSDETALAQSLTSMPLRDPALAAPLMHAVVGQCAFPSRLTTAVVLRAGRPTEEAIRSAGFAPLIEAILAHAQRQLAVLVGQPGPFVDIDLVCRGIERFHRLLRSVTLYVDLQRAGRWSNVCAGLTRAASERLDPQLRAVPADIAQSLRRARDGSDRIDEDRLLAALNGMYLMVAVRDARDSLALNVTLDKVWTETGQALELLLERNFDELRAGPDHAGLLRRVETGIKLGGLRFGADYAEAMTRAFDNITRRRSA